MADPLTYVTRGQALRIPAEAYNAFVDAGRAVRDGQFNSVPTPQQAHVVSGSSIKVQNNTSGALDRFAIVTLGAPLYQPPTPSFFNQPVLVGATPAVGDIKLAVLQEPVADGGIANAIVSGATPVQITVSSEAVEPRFAKAGASSSILTAAAEGPATILWREGGTGDQWAVVNMSGVSGTVFPVTMTQTSGSQGSDSTIASWKYDVLDLAGNTLLSDVSPTTSPHKWRRASAGYINVADFGAAFYDSTGALVLMWINEVYEQEACS